MKIVIAHFSSLWVNTSGGVEKMVCALSSALVKRGHSVEILYIQNREGAPYFPIDPRVRTTNLLYKNGKQIISEILPPHLRIYREAARLFSKTKAREINAQYKGKMYGKQIRKWFDSHTDIDVVISVSSMSAKYLMIDGVCKVPMVEMIHEDPEIGFPVLSEPEKDAMNRAKAIQVLLPRDLEAVKKYFPHVPAVVIGNVSEPGRKLANPGKEKKRYKILNVGTICSRKNQELLVKAFHKLAEKYPDWDVEFWGWKISNYGWAVQKYIDLHHLEGRVHLNGVTKEMEKIYAESDIFAYPSRSEGFPLGLIEAMSAGLPAVGLYECHGTNDLIQDGVTGYLTDSSERAFQEGLEKLMSDMELREKMGQAAWEESKKYEPEKIWDQWENLLLKVCSQN